VVVFQPELRRGLLRLGLHPVFTRLVGARSMVLDELLEAVSALSHRKIGALIAVQRRVSLAEYAERGTNLNAEVSSELLQTIFQPGAPLHDGAVIVRGNLVVAAGCLFPLSENAELSKLLGTRHRAALGMTEENDAVTIVVSEETGRISLGVEGRLLQGLSPAELRDKLTDLCLESVETSNTSP
jgi:diadenylate cyclase